MKSRGRLQNSGGSWLIPRCLILMLNRKPLLDLEQGQDIMEAVSQEDESGIDVPEDLERGTLEMAAVCSRGGGDTSAAAAILRCLLHLKAVTEALVGGFFFKHKLV